MADVEDLFTAAATERLRSRSPLAARLRPTHIDEIVGQQHVVGRGKPLRVLIEKDALTSMILWGPPGTGKTTIAEVIARTTNQHFVRMSAVTAGVKDIREVVDAARQRLGQNGQSTLVFVDEIHRFSSTQQDALLPSVEEGLITLIGATTENPTFQVNAALRSRSTLFRLEPLSFDDVVALLQRGLLAEGKNASTDVLAIIADKCGGDGRQALTALEVACALTTSGEVEMDHAHAALSARALRYGRDDHYDVISAFIKSIRASDVDAGIHWLARMLESGEDARFIARRLVILASEDIGEADPTSLVIATSAAHALEVVGLPEAQLNLAQAVVHLARAPKSNAVAQAIWTAREDVRNGRIGEVPAHLRDAHYSGASDLGHGVGYVSAHVDAQKASELSYLPDELRDVRYYRGEDEARVDLV
jgi:putative ATPase